MRSRFERGWRSIPARMARSPRRYERCLAADGKSGVWYVTDVAPDARALHLFQRLSTDADFRLQDSHYLGGAAAGDVQGIVAASRSTKVAMPTTCELTVLMPCLNEAETLARLHPTRRGAFSRAAASTARS